MGKLTFINSYNKNNYYEYRVRDEEKRLDIGILCYDKDKKESDYISYSNRYNNIPELIDYINQVKEYSDFLKLQQPVDPQKMTYKDCTELAYDYCMMPFEEFRIKYPFINSNNVTNSFISFLKGKLDASLPN